MGDQFECNDAAEIDAGLRETIAGSFPKHCRACGHEYASVEDYLRETRRVRSGTGLKQSRGDDDEVVVELFRNCTCGSTLLEVFDDRRDESPAGERRRRYFGRLLELLLKWGSLRKTRAGSCWTHVPGA